MVEPRKVESVTELDDIGEVADTETGQTLEIISISEDQLERTALLSGDATQVVFEPVELTPVPYCINFSTAQIDERLAWRYGDNPPDLGYGDGILGYEIFYENGESAFKRPEVMMTDGASLATCHSSVHKITLSNYQGVGWMGVVQLWNIDTGRDIF